MCLVDYVFEVALEIVELVVLMVVENGLVNDLLGTAYEYIVGDGCKGSKYLEFRFGSCSRYSIILFCVEFLGGRGK